MRRRHAAWTLGLVLLASTMARSAATEPHFPPGALGTAPGSRAPAALAPRAPEPTCAWARQLAPLHVEWGNGPELGADVRLYRDDGTVDPDALQAFVRAVGGGPIATRTVQLVVKAAYHFGAHAIEVVSAYRPGPRRGPGTPHSSGDAIDFRLPGVGARKLAAYLRTEARAGVGIYTNPGTLYVHVDARTMSFHWVDASPPGKTWRERSLADPTRDERDLAYAPEQDLPLDAAAPPSP